MSSNDFQLSFTNLLKFLGRKGVFWVCIGILGSIFLACCELAIASFLQVFLKAINLIPQDMKTISILPVENPSIFQISVMLIVIGIVRCVGSYFTFQSIVMTQERMYERLRALVVYDMLLNKEQKFVSSSEVHFKNSELFPRAVVFSYQTVQALSISILSGCFGIILLKLAWREALVGISGLLFVACLIFFLNKKIRAISNLVPAENKSLLRGIERIASNWFLVRVLRTQKMEHQKLLGNINRYASKQIHAMALSNIPAAGTPFIGILLLLVIIWLSQTVFNTESTILLAFLYLFIRFVQNLATGANSISTMSYHWNGFVQTFKYFLSFSDNEISFAMKSLEQIGSKKFDLNEKVDTTKSYAFLKSPPSLRLEGVDFYYGNGEKIILSNLNLLIPAGKQFAIIGPSGCGKSTLLSIIMGVLQPRKGTILIEGDTPSSFYEKYSRGIGYAGPDSFLFAGSIKDNLTYGMENEFNDEDCWQALNYAGIADFVKELPTGLHHFIPENGEGLSAGQKQRISLARALISKPSLLILDEISANLDEATETNIAESLKVNFSNKTTIIIVSHRKGFLKYADNVFEMGN